MGSVKRIDNWKQKSGRKVPKPWMARYRGPDGKQHSKTFSRKVDAEQWLLAEESKAQRGVWTDPTAGAVSYEDHETGLDLLGLAVTRDWVDQPAVARRDQLDAHRPRELEPLHPGEEDSRQRMIRRARQRIIERQEQRRSMEPTLGRGL